MTATAGLRQTAHITRNPHALHGEYPAALRSIISLSEHRLARDVIITWSAYQPTRLHELRETASELCLGRVWLKDESTRFGLGAFKSVGGAYAVHRLIQQLGTREVTVACASAGNHGRAVAWGAKQFGAGCVVYLYEGVSEVRRKAIEALGATVDASSPSYEHAVRRVAVDAERRGWHVISDTAYADYTEIPRTVMHGYTVIAQEALEQMPEPPTHVILQAGVGGFAAAIAAHFWETFGSDRPTFITVEPVGLNCVQASLAAGEMLELPHASSIMGGLACTLASTVAWDVLSRATDWAVSIPDAAAIEAMRALAGLGVTSGESGAAGFAGLHALCSDRHVREQAGLDERARVLLFSTEGATDPERYHQFTGIDPLA